MARPNVVVSPVTSLLDELGPATKSAKVGELERKPARILARVRVPVCPPRYRGDEPTEGWVVLAQFGETQRNPKDLSQIRPPELRLVLLRGKGHARQSVEQIDGVDHLKITAVCSQIDEAMLALFASVHGELVKQMK